MLAPSLPSVASLWFLFLSLFFASGSRILQPATKQRQPASSQREQQSREQEEAGKELHLPGQATLFPQNPGPAGQLSANPPTPTRKQGRTVLCLTPFNHYHCTALHNCLPRHPDTTAARRDSSIAPGRTRVPAHRQIIIFCFGLSWSIVCRVPRCRRPLTALQAFSHSSTSSSPSADGRDHCHSRTRPPTDMNSSWISDSAAVPSAVPNHNGNGFPQLSDPSAVAAGNMMDPSAFMANPAQFNAQFANPQQIVMQPNGPGPGAGPSAPGAPGGPAGPAGPMRNASPSFPNPM